MFPPLPSFLITFAPTYSQLPLLGAFFFHKFLARRFASPRRLLLRQAPFLS